jgi:hypothetical protein
MSTSPSHLLPASEHRGVGVGVGACLKSGVGVRGGMVEEFVGEVTDEVVGEVVVEVVSGVVGEVVDEIVGKVVGEVSTVGVAGDFMSFVRGSISFTAVGSTDGSELAVGRSVGSAVGSVLGVAEASGLVGVVASVRGLVGTPSFGLGRR